MIQLINNREGEAYCFESHTYTDVPIEVLHHHVTYAATVTTPPCWMACRSNMAREVSERVPSLPGYFAGLNLDDKKSYEEKFKKISNIDPYNLSASFYSDSSEN